MTHAVEPKRVGHKLTCKVCGERAVYVRRKVRKPFFRHLRGSSLVNLSNANEDRKWDAWNWGDGHL